MVAARLIRPACVFWTWSQAVNLARGPRPVSRRNRPAVLKTGSVFSAACAAFFVDLVQQLVNVKTPGLARSYAGPVARAAPGGPLTW